MKLISLTSFFLTLTLLSNAMASDTKIETASTSNLSLSAVPLHDPQADYPGSPELALTAPILIELAQLNADGKIYEAWSVLASQKDGYAQSAVRIFGEKLTLQRCTVESNWKVVVGKAVREQNFSRYAQMFQHHYITYLQQNLRYPNTFDIEKMYQQTNSEMGLPQRISVDLMFNTVPEDWDLRQFLDGIGAALGFGRYANKMRWYHYIDISEARMSPEMVKIEDASIPEMKANYKETTKEIALCMFRKLRLTLSEPRMTIINPDSSFGN